MQKALTLPKRYYKEQDSSFPLEQKILLGLLGVAGCTTMIVVGVKMFHQIRARRSDAKSFDDGSPAGYAKLIKNALLNRMSIGVDLDTIRYVLRQIKNKEELAAVQKEYRNQNGNDEMLTDIGLALKPYELQEMMEIIAGKRQPGEALSTANYRSWAIRIHNAIYQWGTDEDAIRSVFIEIPTRTDYAKVEQAYYIEYGVTMQDDLDGDIELWEAPGLKAIINSKPIA